MKCTLLRIYVICALIDCIKIDTIFEEYGLVRTGNESDHGLVKKLWKSLDCETCGGISLKTVENVIYAIMNIAPDPMPDSQEFQPSVSFLAKPSMGSYFSYCFYLDPDESNKFHEEFKPLYLNKISLRECKVVPEVYTHHPKLSEGTLKLARKNRISPEKLYEQRIARKAAFLNEVERTKAEIDKECTFKPKILEYCAAAKGSMTDRKRY